MKITRPENEKIESKNIKIYAFRVFEKKNLDVN